MTKAILSRLIKEAKVKDVGPARGWQAGIFVKGMTREELAEIVTLAESKLYEQQTATPEPLTYAPSCPE